MNDPIPFRAVDWQTELAVSHELVLETTLGFLRGSAPWSFMPLDDVMGHLRPIAIAVLGAERDPDERRRMIALHRAAVEHVAFRRAQDCGRRVIHAELLALGEGIRFAIELAVTGPAQLILMASIADAELRRVRRTVRRALRGA
ncbi:MAG TPA: hypothetical protein VHB25_04675 [Gemmatimonadaceae bacterium]|nr:hypothetical protein [Gemmatimonadaceae bacterium]